MKLSRRRLAALAATPLLARTAVSQTPAPQPQLGAAPADLAQAVREANRRNSETLAKFDVPIATEPAFKFWP